MKQAERGRAEYYLSKLETKYYNAKINDGNFFDQPVNNDLKTLPKNYHSPER